MYGSWKGTTVLSFRGEGRVSNKWKGEIEIGVGRRRKKWKSARWRVNDNESDGFMQSPERRNCTNRLGGVNRQTHWPTEPSGRRRHNYRHTHAHAHNVSAYIHAYIDCVGRINHNDKSTPLQYCLRLAAVRYATLHKYTWSTIRRLYEIILHSLNLQSPAAYIIELRGPSLMVFWIFDDGCVAYKNHGFMVVLYVVVY